MKRIIPAFVAAIFALPVYAGPSASAEILAGHYSHKPDGWDRSTNTGLGIRAAIHANENIALEVGYQRFGKGSWSYSESSYLGTSSENIDITLNALTLGLKGSKNLNSKLSLNGRLGMAFWDADIDYNYQYDYVSSYIEDDKVTASETEDGHDIYFGIGVDYQITSKLYASASYTQLNADDYKISGFQVGLGMNF